MNRALDDEVRRAVTSTPHLTLPLGRWLAHEVVLVAHEHAAGVGARAAVRIGLPQTTFARRLRHADTDRQLTARPASWTAVRGALAAAIAAPDLVPEGFADRVETLLLDVVLRYAPSPLAYAAALMGLSPPTMKQRLAARQAAN
jgi:DNA-binding protein Fis